MAAGFVDKKDKDFYIYIFDKFQETYKFRDCHKITAESSYLAGIIDELEFVYLNVNIKNIQFRLLEFPFSEKEKIKEIIPFQIKEMITSDIEDIVWDFIPVEKIEDSSASPSPFKVLLAFIDKSFLREILTQIPDNNIRPSIITSVETFHAFVNRDIDSLFKAFELNEDDKLIQMSSMFSSNKLNFAKGEFLYRDDIAKALPYIKLGAFFAVFLYVFLCVHLMLDIINMSEKEKRINKDIKQIYSSLMPEDSRIINPLYQLKSHKKQLDWKVDEFNDINPLHVLKLISEEWGAGSSIDEIEALKDLITIKGEADNADQVKTMADVLQDKFSGEPVIETKQSSGTKIGYTIQVRRNL